MTTNTEPAPPLRRLPAEWEPQEAVLMAWPHALTDWNYMLDDVRECFRNIVTAILQREKVIVAAPEPEEARRYLGDHPNLITAAVPTNDTWARDFGPVTVYTRGERLMLDFTFNGWGLKFAANHDNMVTRRLHASGTLPEPLDNCLYLVLEGGSIESDGRGTVLSTSHCLHSPNRNPGYDETALRELLEDELGADRLLLLNHGYLAGDDTDSHIDTLARLAPHDTIIYCGPPEDTSDEHYEELTKMKAEIAGLRTTRGLPYNMLELPMPDAVYDEDGQRLPATYANYLPVNGAVLVPSYGQPRKDRLAAQMLRVAYPDREIISIDCRALIRQHGSLHCMTMQIPVKL